MRLIVVYVAFVLAGTLIATGAGELTEIWSEQASLFVFLALFFASLWVGWRLALRVA